MRVSLLPLLTRASPSQTFRVVSMERRSQGGDKKAKEPAGGVTVIARLASPRHLSARRSDALNEHRNILLPQSVHSLHLKHKAKS